MSAPMSPLAAQLFAMGADAARQLSSTTETMSDTPEQAPTPRTDANQFARDADQFYVTADFARTLERELATANACADRLADTVTRQARDLAALRAERDALKTTEEDLRQQASDLMAANSRQITVIRRLRESVDALVKERDAIQSLVAESERILFVFENKYSRAPELRAAIDAARSSGGKGATP